MGPSGNRTTLYCLSLLLNLNTLFWTVQTSMAIGNIKRMEKEHESNVDPEQVFGLTTKNQERVVRTLRWIQQRDRELFPLEGAVDVAIPDFRKIRVFHAPSGHSSFYGVTPHGVYRVIETDKEKLTELYPLTDERVDYVESLIPGRSSDHTPVTEWLMVSDFVT